MFNLDFDAKNAVRILKNYKFNTQMEIPRVLVESTQQFTVHNLPTWMPLINLDESLRFIYPVMVKITLSEEKYFIAECPTFDIFTSGSSYEEALDNIKSILVEDYKSFLEDYPDGLTSDAKKLLQLYRAFFGEALPY